MLARTLTIALFAAAVLGLAASGRAEMILSQVIVDLWPGERASGDIEVWNDGAERMQVSVEPFEIRDAGKPAEQRVPVTSTATSGIVVSPSRLALQPGARRMIRIAAVGERSATDRVYRVAIKPVAAPATANANALKVFVGYDTLVIVRPGEVTGDIEGQRNGRTLRLVNTGNTARELLAGRQCDAAGGNCQALPAKRLYSGAAWDLTLPFDAPVSYRTVAGRQVRERQF